MVTGFRGGPDHRPFFCLPVHCGVSKRRNIVGHGVIHPKSALFPQLQGRHPNYHLGQGKNAHDIVKAKGAPGGDIGTSNTASVEIFPLVHDAG